MYLVGCGPGSADLLTLRAVNLMRRADVVLYDRLVSEETLSYCSSDAVLVYVGKQESLHSRSQEEINELIGIFASELDESSTVVRLKGVTPSYSAVAARRPNTCAPWASTSAWSRE